MKKINISSTEAKLANLNIRTEGNQSEPHRAVDLKFEAVLPSTVLRDLCGTDDVPPFWKGAG